MPNRITHERPRGRRRSRRSRVGGPLIWTPGMIADHMRQTNNSVKALDRDYTAAGDAGHLPPKLEDAWSDWVNQWRKFFANNKNAWTGGTIDRSEDYRKQLLEWRRRLAPYHKPQSPPPHIDPDSGAFTFFQGAGLGGIVVAGVIIWVLSRSG